MTITKWMYDLNNPHHNDIYTVLFTEDENYIIKPQTRVDLLIDIFSSADDFPDELDIDPVKLKYDIAGRKNKKSDYTPNEEIVKIILDKSVNKHEKEAGKKSKVKKNIKVEEVADGKIYYYENVDGKITKIKHKYTKKKSEEPSETSKTELNTL